MNDRDEAPVAVEPQADIDDDHHGATHLLALERFRPYFSTQFLGAFNDNVYKNALIGLLTYQTVRLGVTLGETKQLINLAAGLFIAPFFIFSATAGQIADKYEKSMLIRRIKIGEILIMLVGAAALLSNSLTLLFVVLVFMGSQSSFFGPIKYGILPQHLHEDELMGGNALVETGTFLAILIGTVLGGLMVNVESFGTTLVAATVVTLAMLGYLASRGVPAADPVDPTLKINWNFASETWRILAATKGNRTVFLAMMGISWFWFYGSIFLAQVPAYGRDFLGGSQSVVTLLLATFTIGIGAGSMLCQRLSGKLVEIGLVPLGAFGMTVFAFDLAFATPPPPVGDLIDAGRFLGRAGSWRVIFDLLGIAMTGGMYIVPLYALVQTRAERRRLSRTIAGINIMNALFMIVAAFVAILLLRAGLDIPQLFLVVSLMNIAVAVFIFTLVPEFLMRLIDWALVHTIYRLDNQDLRNIPLRGAAVLVCNHVSYVDALIIASASRRPPRFVIYHKFYNLPVLHFVFRTGRAIPIAPAKEDPELLEKAYDEIDAALAAGEIVCLFPEGKLTSDGEMNPFRSGIEKIIRKRPVPVVPMALQGLWDSLFSRRSGKRRRRFGRLFSRIGLIVGEPVPPERVTKELLYERVAALRGDQP